MQLQRIIDELLSLYRQVEYVKDIKSGKEASVYLFRIDGELCALKVYKEQLKYSTKQDYINLTEIGDARTMRAIQNKSAKGISSLNSTWTQREFKIMEQMSNLTSLVPEVYDFGADFIVMQFIGTDEDPAPRLSDVQLSAESAEFCAHEILSLIALFIQNDFVHGDLSAYNILFHDENPIVIDFPQILKISQNKNAYDKLQKDVENIKDYFAPYQFDFIDNQIKKVYDLFWIKSRYG